MRKILWVSFYTVHKTFCRFLTHGLVTCKSRGHEIYSKNRFPVRTNTHTSSMRTHVKISHLVASLPTSRQQVVFAILVPSCQQVWNKLLTTCNNLVDIIRLVARLFQQVRCSHDITILLQPCALNLVPFLLYHDCIRLVGTTL